MWSCRYVCILSNHAIYYIDLSEDACKGKECVPTKQNLLLLKINRPFRLDNLQTTISQTVGYQSKGISDNKCSPSKKPQWKIEFY